MTCSHLLSSGCIEDYNFNAASCFRKVRAHCFGPSVAAVTVSGTTWISLQYLATRSPQTLWWCRGLELAVGSPPLLSITPQHAISMQRALSTDMGTSHVSLSHDTSRGCAGALGKHLKGPLLFLPHEGELIFVIKNLCCQSLFHKSP